MTNEEYINKHRDEDVRSLALKKVPEGVDAHWCLQQIEGWQLARKKLPQWAEREGVWFPPRLSMEQCSSEATAQYKSQVLGRILTCTQGDARLVDLTGGFGIDFSYLAQAFGHATYVEQHAHLCDIARHNMPLLGLGHAQVVCASAEEVLASWPQSGMGNQATTIYLDPARRDDAGRKVAALEDCTPNVLLLQDELLSKASLVMVKLSPMLDITQAVRQLKEVIEVHVISLKGECKEVLVLMAPSQEGATDHYNTREGIVYHCVNLNTPDEPFVCTKEQSVQTSLAGDQLVPGALLFEPNASILKAGVQDQLCQRYDIHKLHPMSNLFMGRQAIAGFPGRQFVVEAVGDFSKAGIKHILEGVRQANLTIRNFPSTVAELRKRLKVKEGGDVYLFATTLSDGSHALLRCRK